MTRRTQLQKLMNEDLLLVNPQDAARKNISDGETIKMSSARGSIHIRTAVSSVVNPGILSTTFHFPEVMVNILTGDTYDSEAMCPEYKVISVDINKIK